MKEAAPNHPAWVPPKTQAAEIILVVDDEDDFRRLMVEYLKTEGYTCLQARDGLEARGILEQERVQGLVTDLRMKPGGGMDLLAWLGDSGPDLAVVVVSAWGDIQDALQAMNLGATDYLSKPFEPDELGLRLKRALKLHRMEKQPAPQGKALAPDTQIPSRNQQMIELYRLATQAAPSPASILIGGESGTGKEVLARWIHGQSGRSGDFVAINLGGIPDTLLESELFGYERGAFSGADRRKPGLVELAQGGTLFLDEIGDMPLMLQVKLLRVLQERRIQRLGAQGSIPVDIRLIAASHVDLDQAVVQGSFREDLLYRLNTIRLVLPPLRERLEDLPALLDALLIRHRRSRDDPRPGPRALAALARHRFPGNIRELENMVQRALIVSPGPVLEPADFGLTSEPEIPGSPKPGQSRFPGSPPPSGSPAGQGVPPPGSSLAEIERWAIIRALETWQGHRERSAGELGISRRTLLNKMREYDIDFP